MKKRYAVRNFLFISLAFIVIAVPSCKKDNNTKNSSTTTTVTGTPGHIGLYESSSSIYKLIYLDVSKVGSLATSRGLIFDTGSGGMVLDADSILASSMYNDNGFIITGDSLTYKGITVTKDTASVVYGDDASTEVTVYGNLAYADVTLDEEGGNVVIKRLPFFLYYKAVDAKGVKQTPHDFDVFGVNEEYDTKFANGTKYITSPFSYYDPGTGYDKGFKMAALGTSNFSYDGTYVNNVVTIGLSTSDKSGFSLNQLSTTGYGYEPTVSGTITYSGSTITATMLFDSGTEPYNYIENYNAPRHITDSLAAHSKVSTTTSSGLTYGFTVVDTVGVETINNKRVTVREGDYLTYIENPRDSGVDISIFSLEYFLNNEYMLDYTTHQLGLKSN